MQTKRFLKVAITTFVFMFTVAGVVNATTTTIGSNITTGGTLTVTGATTLTGATTMSAALTLTSTTNPQVTVKYDTANYLTTYVGSTGTITFDSVGTAVHSVFLFSDTVTIATTTNESLLTIDGSTSSTTFAVYQAGAGDILTVNDGSTEVFTILDGGNMGIGTSTPQFVLSVNGAGSGFAVNSSGVVVDGTWQGALIAHEYGGLEFNASAVTTGGLIRGASSGVMEILALGTGGQLLGVTGGQIGYIATSTFAHLADDNVFAGTASTTFAGYIDIAKGLEVGANKALTVHESASVASLVVHSNSRVGISTTTPSAMFSVGNSAGDHSATSTIDFAMPCFRMTVDDGGTKSDLYYWPSSIGTLGGWATSTTSCY